MLIISKPTKFGADGFAVRGQCSHDAPGWQLRWFYEGEASIIWEGAFQTCRYLQDACRQAKSLSEARRLISEYLASDMRNIMQTLPTDVYSSINLTDPFIEPAEHKDAKNLTRKKKKKKRRL